MASPARTAPVRLTRRGRVVITLVMMVGLVLAGFTLGRGSSQAAGHARVAHRTVTVEAGDTLWSVAARVAPHADPRDVVDEITAMNRLASAVVQPGERLLVPVAG
ncbi:MAG TPA: LysM peptidoglycan-binding domain-containing protein [Mycobacteriales bacterium]|nr:LysM peptidoglycan-binding domain-containing protein [Mycobacteriales bacterium]